jgi:hypothetical protein
MMWEREVAIALSTGKQSHTYSLVDGTRLLVYDVRKKSGKSIVDWEAKKNTYGLVDGTRLLVYDVRQRSSKSIVNWDAKPKATLTSWLMEQGCWFIL